MIVEQRDYHVYTGKLPELLRLYEEEGIPIQQEILGGLVGAFTTDDRRALDVLDALALRLVRRARGAPRAPAGRPALEGVPREGAAALPHAAEPDPRPDVVLAASR